MSKDTMHLLIIEDDEVALGTWRRDIDDFNECDNKEVELILHTAQDQATADQMLNDRTYHFLITDMRLPSATAGIESAPDAAEGNTLIQKILNHYPSTIAINTGHPGEVDSEIQERENIKIFTKGTDDNASILHWLYDHRELAKALHITAAEMQSLMAKLFHNTMWPRWEHKWSQALNPQDIQAVITRQSAAYIAETITHKISEGSFHHPEEFYFIPPVREKLHTGDLTKIDDKIFIVISPQCDMANSGYPAHILIAECKQCTASNKAWQDYTDNRTETATKKKEKARKSLRDLITQNIPQSEHFIPPCDERGPWLISFKEVRTISSENVSRLLHARFASLAPPFIPNLIQRFSSFIGRVGQPDLCPEHTAKMIDNILASTSPDILQ